MEQDVTSYQPDLISYDKIDPLPTEKPFYSKDDSKINQFLAKNEEKFPWIHMGIFGIVIPFFTFLMGLFYIGGIWNPIEKIPELNYLVINEDAGCVGVQCTGAFKNINLGSSFDGLNGKGAGNFEVTNGTIENAIDKIDKHEYWMALHVPQNFTMTILANLLSTDKTDVVVTRVYDEARSFTTVTFVKKVFDKVQEAFHAELIKEIEKKMEALSVLTSSTPMTFNPLFRIEGITYVDNNLYPIDVYGQYFCTFVSFILIWIGTIAVALITHFVFPLEGHWVEKKDTQNAIAKTIGAKTATTVALLFVICLIISIIPLCCGTVTMKKGYGAVLFFFFFFSLSGIGVNNLIVHLFHFINFYLIACTFMILQFITCGGVIHRDLQYSFFSIGKAFPMFYATREIKYIYFGSGKHTQASNILIILGWAIIFLVASYYLYYLELKTKRKNYLKRNSK